MGIVCVIERTTFFVNDVVVQEKNEPWTNDLDEKINSFFQNDYTELLFSEKKNDKD